MAKVKFPLMKAAEKYAKDVVAGKILVCKPCAATRMIGEDDLPSGFFISTGVTLIELAEEAQVFSF